MSAAPQTHADAETLLMQAGVAAHLAALKRAVDAVGRTSKAVAAATDVLAAFQQAGAFIVACEGLEDAAADAVRRMRDYLAERMVDTGATTISSSAHQFATSKPPRSVMITGAVPDEYMTTPAAAPDKKKIGAELRAGKVFPWAELSNGGPYVLVIKAKG